MSKPTSLEVVLNEANSAVDWFRSLDIRGEYLDPRGHLHWSFPIEPYSFPDEYTNWLEEQRAWRKNCVFIDQSYHMVSLYLEGPDALTLLSDLGVNDFTDFREGESGQAKQLVMCNTEGNLIGDSILFYLEENKFLSVSNAPPQNWLQYNAEIGPYNVSATKAYSPYKPGSPTDFRFEIQGPYATDVMERVTDGTLPEISFFEMERITIHGKEFWAFGHGMAGAKGMEFFGSYDYHDTIKDSIMEAGREFGIRQLGTRSYKTTPLESGWIPLTLPAIYNEDEMKDYRQWLGADSLEANWSIGGSYKSDNISDYYMNPIEMGYERIISFNHDFIGKDALEEKTANSSRKKVTFVWSSEDVLDISNSLMNDGETYKFIELPDPSHQWCSQQYDKVTKGGELVGLSRYVGYNYNERKLLSLGVIDQDYSDIGNTVTITWGEIDSPKNNVENHIEKDIRAKVAPAPYVSGRGEI